MSQSNPSAKTNQEFFVRDSKGQPVRLSRIQVQNALDSLKLFWNQEISLDGKKWVPVSTLKMFLEPKYAIKKEFDSNTNPVYYKHNEIQRRIDHSLLTPEAQISCNVNKCWVPLSSLSSLFNLGYDVYIAHLAEQDHQATSVALFLRKQGLKVWVDHLNLLGVNSGKNERRLSKSAAIQQSKCFLLMHSLNANVDAEIMDECRSAKNYDKKLILLKLSDAPLSMELLDIMEDGTTINGSKVSEEKVHGLIHRCLAEDHSSPNNAPQNLPQKKTKSSGKLYYLLAAALSLILLLSAGLFFYFGFNNKIMPSQKPTSNLVENKPDSKPLTSKPERKVEPRQFSGEESPKPDKPGENTVVPSPIKRDTLEEKILAWSKSDLLLELPGKILLGLKVQSSSQSQQTSLSFRNLSSFCLNQPEIDHPNCLSQLLFHAKDLSMGGLAHSLFSNSCSTSLRTNSVVIESSMKFKVVDKTDDGKFISSLKEGLKNYTGPVIAHKPLIIKKIFHECQVGDQVPEELSAEISTMFQEKPGITLKRSKDDYLDFITFRYKNNTQIEFGLFENADSEQLTYKPFGRDSKVISKSDIALESVYRAKGVEILKGITESKFNEYCYFTIAHHLLNFSHEGYHLSNRKNLLIVPQIFFPTIRQPIEINALQLRVGESIVNSSIQSENLGQAIVGGWIGMSFMNNALLEHDRDVQRYQKEVMEQERAKLLIAKIMQQYADNLEKLKIDICDPTYLDLINNAQDKKQPINELELLDKYHATHLLRLRYSVASDQLNPNYGMTATLLEKSQDDGSLKQVWSQESPEFLIPEHIKFRNEFFLDTGEIVDLRYPDYKRYLKTPSETKYDKLIQRDQQATNSFYEANPVLAPASYNTKAQHLVYLDQWDNKAYVRPLFSVERHELTHKVIDYVPPTKNPDVKYDLPDEVPWMIKKINNIEEVPNEHQLRYLIAGLLKEILPVAGKVVSVNKNERTAKVLFGQRISSTQSIKHGDKLRAIRIDQNGMANPLPVQLTVRNVYSNQVDMSLAVNDMEQVWSELGSINVGDIIFKPSRINHVIGFAPFLPMYDESSNLHRKLLNLRATNDIKAALANDSLFISAKDGTTLMNILVDNIHSLGYQTQTLPKTSYQYAVDNIRLNRASNVPTYDADAVMKNMYHDLINTSNATNVVGCYITPVDGNVDVQNRAPTLNVSRYNVWIGIRNASPDTYKSDKSDLWHLDINPLHLKQQ